jgi:protein gp37
MGQAKYQRDGDPRTSGPGFGVTVRPEALLEPLRWRKPRKVVVDSMAGCFQQWSTVRFRMVAGRMGC